MTFLGELSDVIPEGLACLLGATLQITGVARPYVSALEVAGEDLLKIFPTIDRDSRQVVKTCPSRVG
jgi:hypothetical protein